MAKVSTGKIIIPGDQIDNYLKAMAEDELHHHNQKLVGTLHATSLLWSTDMKTAVNIRKKISAHS